MYKRYKLLSRGILSIILILLFLSIILIIDTYNENKVINKDIENFKARGQLTYQIDNINYYKVTKKYDYEDCSNIYNKSNNIYIGTTGDIYISNHDPLGGFFITEWFSKQAWIGHAGLVYSEDAKKTLEIVGNKSSKNNVVKVYENEWSQKNLNEYLVLRVKGIDEDFRQEIKKESDKIIGCKYNYLFMFGMGKRFYCTNMVSHIYKELGISLNEDSFYTMGADIISNDNTYIIYYKEKYTKNNKECYNIYYLDEE